jgi:hypothetical protein
LEKPVRREYSKKNYENLLSNRERRKKRKKEYVFEVLGVETFFRRKFSKQVGNEM